MAQLLEGAVQAMGRVGGGVVEEHDLGWLDALLAQGVIGKGDDLCLTTDGGDKDGSNRCHKYFLPS